MPANAAATSAAPVLLWYEHVRAPTAGREFYRTECECGDVYGCGGEGWDQCTECVWGDWWGVGACGVVDLGRWEGREQSVCLLGTRY